MVKIGDRVRDDAGYEGEVTKILPCACVTNVSECIIIVSVSPNIIHCYTTESLISVIK